MPVEKYDLVINDFEYITAASCAKKKIPSIQFGHQASFQSDRTPRPANKNSIGEWMLKNYARATHHVGLHFEKYDEFIFHPVVKKELLDAEPSDENYITVYLPSYCEPQLEQIFHPLKEFQFSNFFEGNRHTKKSNNIGFLPVNRSLLIKASFIAQALSPEVALKLPQKRYTLGKKLFRFLFAGNMSKFVTQRRLKN